MRPFIVQCKDASGSFQEATVMANSLQEAHDKCHSVSLTPIAESLGVGRERIDELRDSRSVTGGLSNDQGNPGPRIGFSLEPTITKR